jgi:O-antigen/teichoic acid export membrane protein
MWWLVNNSTRYIILLFLGVTGNGLFAVATKLPTIINVFTGVFTQAWQLSAFEEYKSEDQSEFYSTVFQLYYQLLFVVSSAVMIFVLPITTFIISAHFFESWRMITALILGAVFQTFAGFLGSIYTAAMQTKGVFSSSVIGALISVGSNFLFIPLLGTSGAGIGTVIGFFVMFLIRLRDTRKLVYTKVNIALFSMNIALFIVQGVILSMTYNNIVLNVFSECCLFFIVILINRNLFLQIYRKLL